MHIVLVHNIVAPYRIPLFEELAKRFNLSVLICDQGDLTRKWSQDIKTEKFKFVYLRKNIFGPFVLNFSIFSELRKCKADVYIIIDNEENLFTNLCVIAYAKLRRKSYIVWSGHVPVEHGGIHPADFHKTFFHTWPLKPLYFGFIGLLNWTLYKNAKSFLAYSNASQRYLESYNVTAAKIFTGTQSKPVQTMPPKSKVLKLPKKLNILYLGYLRPEKGVDVLVRAVLRLPKSRVALHIVGDGPERKKLRTIANKANNIIFHPYAHGIEMANWYSSVDLCALPTYHDPWAHVVTESLYYGTPVLVTASAAASMVINPGATGFVVNAGDEVAMAKVIKKLIDEPALVKIMKKNIQQADLSRLYDVESDAENFMKAVTLATKEV